MRLQELIKKYSAEEEFEETQRKISEAFFQAERDGDKERADRLLAILMERAERGPKGEPSAI